MVKKRTTKKTEKVCMSSGYAYELDDSKKNWEKTSDESWDITLVSDRPATILGYRRIDGAQMTVVKAGSKIYAQSALHLKKC